MGDSQQHSRMLRCLHSKGTIPLALSFVQLGYAGYFILCKAALSNGANRFVFAVYRDIIGLLFLAPFAYLTERWGTKVSLLSHRFLMPVYCVRSCYSVSFSCSPSSIDWNHISKLVLHLQSYVEALAKLLASHLKTCVAFAKLC